MRGALMERVPRRVALEGDSVSAIQSSRHSSCATRAHGQGLRQGEVVGVSSVESAKQIQHFLTEGSSSAERLARCGCALSVCSGEVASFGGLLRKRVCESSEVAERVRMGDGADCDWSDVCSCDCR